MTLASFDSTVVGCYNPEMENNPANITNERTAEGRKITISESFITESRNVSLTRTLTRSGGNLSLEISNTAAINESCRTEVAYTAVIKIPDTDSEISAIEIKHNGTVVATVNSTKSGSGGNASAGVTTRSSD
ncbi:hypothetical protein NGM07_23340 (plasmid) [Halorussus vallis]|uniref:hypothetical protein n=1 Tax=Halorussus vallis TaxID=2953749 RepID=UPI00209DB624|nr:hypothetical protein [Halorussus vallis]USZ78273.1 hypothetical protein NGM07_23340 [Halorussus vallis]